MDKIHPEGRIVDRKHQWRGVQDLQGYVQDSDLLPENKELLYRFISDARLGKTIKQGAKKKVGVLRQVKYFQDLKKLDRYFKKPLDQVTEQDMERFILDLEEGRFISQNGQPFQQETQVCIKKIIIKFYKWLNKGNKPDMVAWIDTSYQLKDYRTINEEPARAVVKRLHSPSRKQLARNRALFMVLFDSGARADELLNVRLQNLTKEGEIYRIRIEYSKTKKRTVSLPMCGDLLRDWLSVHPHNNEPLAQLFPMDYKNLWQTIRRAGEPFGMKLTPHGLRHSSVTYYAKHLSRYQLCSRYGWAMSSRQPDRYINQEGLEEGGVVQAVEQSERNKWEEEKTQLNRRLAMLEEQLNKFMQVDREEVRKIIAICQEKNP